MSANTIQLILIIAAAVVVLAVVAFLAVRFTGGSKRVEQVTPEQVQKLLESGAVLIDVREISDYRSGHPKGARSVPYSRLLSSVQGIRPDRTLVIISAESQDSLTAANRLKAIGYVRPVSVRGGLPAWIKAGLPMESESDRGPTL